MSEQILNKIAELEEQQTRYQQYLKRTTARPLEDLTNKTSALINTVNAKVENNTFTSRDLQEFIVDLGRLSSLTIKDLDNAHSYIVELEKVKSQIAVLKSLL